MKILMVTLRDGQNVSLAKIADAFINRGHEVIIYAVYNADNVLKFFDEKIPRFPINDLTEEAASDCDMIFASTLAMTRLADMNILSVRKPIITHNFLVNGTKTYGGDFCFVPSLPTTVTDYDEYISCPRIGIGEPKYDTVMSQHTDNKRFLFIDSGHYPFGTEGKTELAKTILDICRSFPDYELWIKPRFLPGDEVISHKNTLHLYDVIRQEADESIPPNLVMLAEHKDLMELINRCCTVICMYTTAYTGAFVADKGLVVLDNIPSEDVYDPRFKVTNRLRSIMLGSGAVIDYKKAKELLPKGVKCSDEYFQYVLTERENTADKICEVTEWLFDTFYRRKIFPNECKCDYKDYKDSIRADDELSWDKVISSRYKNALLQNLLGVSYHVDAKLNVTGLIKRVDDSWQNGSASEAAFKKLNGNQNKYRNECLVENRDNLLADDIDSGILLKAYYQLGKYDEIINFPKRDIGAFYLYRGFVAEEQGDKELVVSNLESYMILSLDRAFMKEISDEPDSRFKALYLLIIYLMEKEENEEKAQYYLEKMKDYSQSDEVRKTVSDSLKKLYYTYIHWAENVVNHCATVKTELSDQPMLVYGVGMLGRMIGVLNNTLLKDRIIAFVDKYSSIKTVNRIPVIRPEEINDYKDVHIVLVAILNGFEDIKRDLLKIRSDLEIVSVNDLF